MEYKEARSIFLEFHPPLVCFAETISTSVEDLLLADFIGAHFQLIKIERVEIYRWWNPLTWRFRKRFLVKLTLDFDDPDFARRLT